MSNFALKALSLVAAAILAVLVRTVLAPVEQGTSVLQLVLPVEVRNLPKEKIIVEPLIRQVEVTLQGPSNLLAEIASAAPVYKIDLPEVLPRAIDVPLEATQLGIPEGVTVLGLRPTVFHFQFDDIVAREVPVVVTKTGVVDENYTLHPIQASPAAITIRGPRQLVHTITSVETEHIDVSGLKETVIRDLAIRTLPPRLLAEPNVVSVKAEVTPTLITWTLRGVKVALSEGAPEARVQPDTVSVTLSGPKTARSNITAENLIARVSIAPTKQHPVIEGLPQGVEIKSVDEVLTLVAAPTPAPTATKVVKKRAKK